MSLDEVFNKVDLKEAIEGRILSINREPDKVNAMLKIEFVEANSEERSVTYELPVMKWEGNPNDVLHGGISAAMMDLSLGLFANLVCGELGGYFSPTVNMNINYLLPIPVNEKIILKTKLISSGTSLLTLIGEAKIKGSQNLAITASATYKVMKNKQ